MLHHLLIDNYALIQKLDLQLEAQFTTITGETGAGKSIILDALGLLLGGRAEIGSLGNPAEKCIIEGHFAIENYDLQSFFEAEDLDYLPSTCIRREISPQGKSRAFVNDTPVTLPILKKLGQRLLSIHSQHQSLDLHEENFQLQLLDFYAQNGNILEEYQKVFGLFTKEEKELEKLKIAAQDREKERDYTLHLLKELQTLNPNAERFLDLEQKAKMGNSAGERLEIVQKIQQLFESESSQIGVLEGLKKINHWAQKIDHPVLQNTQERLKNALLELEDCAAELQDYGQNLQIDPQTLREVEEELSKYYTLMKKHQVIDVAGLLDFEKKWMDLLDQGENLLEKIAALEKSTHKNRLFLEEKAKILHQKREEAAPKLIEKIEHLLHQMGMPYAHLKMALSLNENLGKYGFSHLVFLFQANKGMSLLPLEKVASGGEASRLMLAIQCIFSKYKQLPTLILDEIDTGVSGEIATKMGQLMAHLGKKIQVLAITHLPQVAAQGKNHLFVYKNHQGEKTQTHIRYLNEKERTEQIAQMLSGANPSAAALDAASELLSQSQKILES